MSKYCVSSTDSGITYPTIPSGQTVYILGNVNPEDNKFNYYSRTCDSNGNWGGVTSTNLATIAADATAEAKTTGVGNIYNNAFRSNTYYVYTTSDNASLAAIKTNSTKDALYSNMINLYLNKELDSNTYANNLKCSNSTMNGITYYGTFKDADGIHFTSTEAAIYKCTDDGWDEQKPFYTVWWFWVIIAVLVIIAIVPLFMLKKGQSNTWQWIVFGISLLAAVIMVVVTWVWFYYF